MLPPVDEVWGTDERAEVGAFVEAVRTVIENLTLLRPSEQRLAITGRRAMNSGAASEAHQGLICSVCEHRVRSVRFGCRSGAVAMRLDV